MQIGQGIAWMSSLMLGLAVAFFALLMTPEDSLDDEAGGSGGRKKQRKSILLRLTYPLIVAVGGVVSALPIEKHRAHLQKKLLQAGVPGGLTPDEFDATRILAFAGGLLAGLFLDNELAMSPVFTVGLALLGIVYPDLWLSGYIDKRRRRIFRDLPDTLDTLRLAVDAGLDLNSALKVVVEKGRQGPLLEEFDRIERDITLGRTRKEAFKNFADRLQMSEVSSFVLALIQADQLGASIGPVLRVQADVARTRRWQLAEVLVNKMPTKMLGPLVTLIFPASFIILFTPLIIQYMQSGE